MKRRIVSDLDGVIRDINIPLAKRYKVPYPSVWDWRFKEKGIFDWIETDNYRSLISAPKTEYGEVIEETLDDIFILTSQPPSWRRYTRFWLTCRMRTSVDLMFISHSEKATFLEDNPDTWLIEDCPNFKDYSRIILINRPYNQEVKCKNRVKTPKELKLKIKEVMSK